jgi:hypothetical protein
MCALSREAPNGGAEFKTRPTHSANFATLYPVPSQHKFHMSLNSHQKLGSSIENILLYRPVAPRTL